jgi:hypothetical protein
VKDEWGGCLACSDLGCREDSRGNIIMGSILETKASTVLEFFSEPGGDNSIPTRLHTKSWRGSVAKIREYAQPGSSNFSPSNPVSQFTDA